MTDTGSNAGNGFGGRLWSRFRPSAAPGVAERTRRRVTLYLIPFLFFLYILAYLDRVNVSVAELRMEEPASAGGMGFSRDEISIGFGIFFWGYWILEIPSTLSVSRWGARWVFVRILILWGICAALVGTIGTPFASSLFRWLPGVPEERAPWEWLATAFHYVNHLHDEPLNQFYFFRFMLGFFEGGFFPSVIVYLSLWFRAEDRAKAIAGFMSAIPLSNVLGNPISGSLLYVDWFGLSGWRWVFILEGIAPVLVGFVTLFFLPDRPSMAKWLPSDERDWLLGELEREQKAKEGRGRWAWVRHLPLVLLLTGAYFCQNVASYGLGSFMPAIVKSQSGASDFWATVLTACAYFLGFLGMQINGRHSDHTKERTWHAAIPLSLLCVGVALAALSDGLLVLPVLLMIFLVGTFMYAHLPAYWPMPTMFLGATAAASAIGFINMIGNLGGSLGPRIVGKASTDQVSFAPSLWLLAPWSLGAAALVILVGYSRPIKAFFLRIVGRKSPPV